MRDAPFRGGGGGSDRDRDDESTDDDNGGLVDSLRDTATDAVDSVSDAADSATDTASDAVSSLPSSPAPDTTDEEDKANGTDPMPVEEARDRARDTFDEARARVTETIEEADVTPVEEAEDPTAREAIRSGVEDRLGGAADAVEPVAQSASFETETARRTVESAPGMLPGIDTDERAIGAPPEGTAARRAADQTEDLAPRDELRRDVAAETEWDVEDITVGFDPDTQQLEADVRDDVIEEEVRQDVLDDIEGGFLGSQAGVDPERVQVERTDDGVDVEIDRESGLSGVESIIRGEQTSRDFLVAEDERFRETLADPAGDLVDGEGTTRTFSGAAVEEGVASFSPAGAAVFADDAATTFADVTEAGPGTTVMIDLDDEQVETLDTIGDDVAQGLEENPAETTGRAAGVAGAIAAPFAAPRVARGAANRAPDIEELGQFRRDTDARLDTRQRQSRDGEQETIFRDDAAADPSDPSVSERVDQITERWSEGTMSRPDRGLDETIVVEPQQRGTAQRSPEDQLPPREEFPSEAAYQRELEAVRARQADDAAIRGQTQDASATGVSPEGIGAAEGAGLTGRSSQFGAAAAAAATPTEHAGIDADAFADTDAGLGFGATADAESDVAGDIDVGVGVDAGVDIDAGFAAGPGGVSGPATDTTQPVSQTQDQTLAQQQAQQQQQRRRGPRRPRLPFPDIDNMPVEGASFGVDVADERVVRDVPDPEELGLGGGRNG